MKKLLAMLLTLSMVLSMAVGTVTVSAETEETRTITDSMERSVEIPADVQRIVCVGVGALRYTCYVGGADRVVGVEDYETKPGMSRLYNYVNFDRFQDLPVTGTNGEPFVEEIINVEPQVIVMSAYAKQDPDELSQKTGTPFELIHANNLANTTNQTGAFNIDVEQVLAWDPDLIFLDFNGMKLINEDYEAHPDFYQALTAVQEGKVYSQISFRSSASNLETALADAYYAACVMFPQQFRDIDPVEKAGEIFTMLLGSNPYDDLKGAGYEFRPIVIGE